MKKIKYILISTLALVFGGCDSFLDTTPEDLKSVDKLFETYNSTENYLFQVYSFVREIRPWDNNKSAVGGSNMDIDYVWDNRTTLNEGKWSPTSTVFDKWQVMYQGIREATFFMQNVDLCADPKVTHTIREQWRAEARCVRAYLYAILLRKYGPVILLYDELVDFTKPSEALYRPRNSWDECVNWVAGEFKDIAANSLLPQKQTKGQWGRMSKDIALAYRSRLLLQSASDLFNGNRTYMSIQNHDGKKLFPQSKRLDKWERAREAAKDLIDQGGYKLMRMNDNEGRYDPYASYKSVFTTLNTVNTEMIFSFLEPKDAHVDHHAIPHQYGGWGGYGVTQEMVDSYAMANGKYPITGYAEKERTTPIIDASSGYSENGFDNFTHPIENKTRRTYRMFINREPRFYVSVLYGGLGWFLGVNDYQHAVVEMYANGKNGKKTTRNHYSTGHAMIKLSSPEYQGDPYRPLNREFVYIRYAEILLNYIEATIEAGELSDPLMFEYWNDIRDRAGLKPILEVYPEASGNQNRLRDLVRRERRVELAFEQHSFFDNRRWLIAEELEGGIFHKMNIDAEKAGGGEIFPDDYFRRTELEKRIFLPSFYLYPIPQWVINRNPLVVQNYKW